MTRKKIRKSPQALSEKQLRILFVLGSQNNGELLTQTQIAERWKIPVTTLNYNFTELKKRGLITKHNQLTDKGIKALRYFKEWDKEFSRKLRAHNIQVVLYLARLPVDFNVKNIFLQPFTNKRYEGLKAELLGCTVLFYSDRKAVAVLPGIYGNSDDEIASALACVVSDLVNGLQQEFKGLRIKDYKIAKFHSMHVAVLDSVIAEAFIMKNKRIYSSGRVAVDRSHGRFELEAESPETALEDVEVLVKYEELARENERLRKLVKELQNGGSK